MIENEYNFLSRKAGFNAALRHFRTVSSYISDISRGENVADLINRSLDDGEIQRFQVKSIISAMLVDKYGYAYKSYNLEETVDDSDKIVDTISEWTNIDFVMAYHNPQTGLVVINPVIKEQWEGVLPLVQDELVVVYAGGMNDEVDKGVIQSAVEDFIKILAGGIVRGKKAYIGPPRSAQSSTLIRKESPVSRTASASPQTVKPGKKRMTPKNAVVVTNELFHNGNVEAWKKIIHSYRTKYPGLDVLIWYENERINDINALFKWGKVKHGTPIMFSVTGDNIKDVSKLKRYLFEGASPRFEAFLKQAPDVILDLF
jgi:hypothetical protein